MARKNTKVKSGFTIIEVVLVLAIAGLIFLMVFVALPALQRSQRDTERKNAISEVNSQLTNYQVNNSSKTNNLPSSGWFDGQSTETKGGEYPTGCTSNPACKFVRDYMNASNTSGDTANTFSDPDGQLYSVLITDNWYNSNSLNSESGLSKDPNNNGQSEGLTGDDETGYTIEGDYSDYIIFIVPGGACSNEYVVKGSGQRTFAILYKMESSGVTCSGSGNSEQL